MKDDQLSAWVSSRSLSTARAEAILVAVKLDASPGLGPDWWHELFAPLRVRRRPRLEWSVPAA